jgi:hypothetical protein
MWRVHSRIIMRTCWMLWGEFLGEWVDMYANISKRNHVCSAGIMHSCQVSFPIAVTINAKQIEHLIEVAREFLMEAVWTRFFPITREILHKLHTERVLGTIKRVWADFSLRLSKPEGRLYQPELGGGALLDLGIYPITWAFLALYGPNARAGPQHDPIPNILMFSTHSAYLPCSFLQFFANLGLGIGLSG